VVSLKKLAKRLRHEASANPKKAAVLGLLLLMAIYFWAPLVRRWVLPEAGAEGQSADVRSSAGAQGALDGPSPGDERRGTSVGPEPLDWQQVLAGMASDPRTRPAAGLLRRRNPFVAPMVAGGRGPADLAAQAAPWTPEQLGLQLSATVVGPARRTAMINGRAFRQGRTVTVTKDGRQIEFRLVEIRPRQVVLEGNGQRFVLSIPEPPGAGRIELAGSAP